MKELSMNSPALLPIQRVHHIARTSRRPQESAKFYQEVLGFRALQRPDFNFRGAWLSGYGVQIHIIENPDPAPAEDKTISPRANHLAFAVDDYTPVRDTLHERGIAFHEQVNAGGIRQIFFHDPDGHHIEIAIYPPDPPFLDLPQ